MLREIKRALRSINGTIFDLIIAFKSCFDSIRSLHKFTLIIPRKDYWIVKYKQFYLIYPKEGFRLLKWDLLDKYSYKPFVQIEKNDVVCDVGAFIGEFTILAAELASKIIVIEPDPNTYRCLIRNTKHIKNLTLVRNPIWNENMKLKFILGYPATESSVINVDSNKKRRIIMLQAKRLDTLFNDLKLEKIDFLKIDAEGAEPEVIEGAEGILNKIRKVVVDCAPERYGKATFGIVKRLLKKAGFKTHIKNYMVYGWRS